MTAKIKLRRCTPRPESELDVPSLRAIELVNDRFTAVVDNRKYWLSKKSSRYDDDMANELHEMAKTIAV